MAKTNEVVKNNWANPAPAGSLALAIATFGLGSLLLGLVDHSATPVIGCWLIGGFVVQIIVAIVMMIKGINTETQAFLLFSSFLMLASGLELIFTFIFHHLGWQVDSSVTGYMWIPIVFAVWFWTPSTLKEAPKVFSIALLALDVAFPITCLMNMGVIGHGYAKLAGIMLFIAATCCTYLGGVSVMNHTFKKEVLPVGEAFINS